MPRSAPKRTRVSSPTPSDGAETQTSVAAPTQKKSRRRMSVDEVSMDDADPDDSKADALLG